ncbi:MAG: metallophosphoesterase [Clostridiales Family XIII bacterium]|jgi:hypothetical protein|nr:metallophosphoesterase [Clostridiales Family XIII bacterium]
MGHYFSERVSGRHWKAKRRLVAVMLTVAMLFALGWPPLTASAATDMSYYLKLDGSLGNELSSPQSAHIGGGSPVYEGGIQGEAIHLTHDNYVRLEETDADRLDYSGSFSIAYWIKLNGKVGGDPVFMGNKNWDSGGNPGWAFVAPSTDFRLNSRSTDGVRGDDLTLCTLGAITEWTHIAATFDTANNIVKAYVNGEPVVSAEKSLAGNLNGAGMTLLGQGYAGGGGLYNNAGMSTDFLLDEFHLQQGVLTPANVKNLYKTSKPRGEFTVTGVSVSPKTVRMKKGYSQRFTAEVTGTGEPEQDVTWEVQGATSADTVIDADGLLKIGSSESASSLKIRAASLYEPSVSGYTTITVSSPRKDGGIAFGVISDVHVGPGSGSNNPRLENAFSFFSDPSLHAEAVVVDGDLTGNGRPDEMAVFRDIKDRKLRVPLIASMGNHEENKWENFEFATGSKANDVKIINGYYFITLSPGSGSLDEATGRSSGDGTGSYGYLREWASAKIAEAEAASPDKPIFVFFHHPINNTFYVSNEQHGSGFENLFDNHPRVVTFSGHIHSPNNTPRSIWQNGGFTAVNTTATCSGELESGMIYGGLPPATMTMSQGLYVEATNDGEVTIKTRDFTAGEWIDDQVWAFNVSEPLPYTDARREPLAEAPQFPPGASIRLSNLNITSVDLTFDQAIMPENAVSDIVYAYRYDFIDIATGQVTKSFKNFSDFILRPMPAVLTQEAAGLKKSTEYEVRIYALDAWNKASTGYLSATFKTTSKDMSPRRPIEYVLQFDGNLKNSGNAAPSAVNMFTLPTKPENYDATPHFTDGKHGQAIRLGKTNFIDLDGNNEVMNSTLIDYGQSFFVGFWANIEYVFKNPDGNPDGGEPGLLSNRNVDADSNKGYSFRTDTQGGRNEIFLEYNPTSGHYARFKLCDIELGKWVHLAAVFDYDNDKVRGYVDGEQVFEADADLSGGIGGVTGQGRNRATFFGSSPWNYTEEHGGFNGSGTAGRHDVTFLADDFVMYDSALNPDEIQKIMEDAKALVKEEDTTPTNPTDDGKTSTTPTPTPTSTPSAVSIASASVAPVSDKAWTGKQIKPALTVKIGDETLTADKDYTLSYGTNKAIGIGSVTITGTGSYTETKAVTFRIIPKKLSVKNVKAGKRCLTVEWAKAASAQKVTGYNIGYRAKGAAKWKTKTVSAKNASLLIKKLNSGKAYQVRARAYKTVAGKKYYGLWSKTRISKKVK